MRYQVDERINFRWLATFCFLQIISLSNYGQSVFTVDTISNTLKGQLPFDRSFILQIEDEHKSIVNLHVYELYYKSGHISYFEKDRDGNIVDDKPSEPGLQVRKSAQIQTSVSPDRMGKFAFFIIDPIDPNKALEIRFIHKFKGEELEELLSLYSTLYEWNNANGTKKKDLDTKARIKMKALIDRLERTVEGQMVTSYGNGTGDSIWLPNRWTNHKQYYTITIDPILTKLNNGFQRSFYGNINYKNFKVIGERAVEKKTSITNTLKIWIGIKRFTISGVQDGQVSLLNGSGTQPAGLVEFNKRLKNIAESIELVDAGIAEIEAFSLIDNTNKKIYYDIIGDFKSIISDLTFNVKLLKSTKMELEKAIDAEDNLRYTTWLGGSNEFGDLETASSYYLIPNIGVTSLMANGNTTNDVYVTPYIGFTVHFRPVDKSIPFKYLKKTFWHKSALEIGLTLSAIKDENNEFSDLLKEMSIMTGIRYKFTRALGVSLGAIWIRQVDANPAIDNTNIVPRVYFGISLDLDFAQAIKSITGKVGL